MPPYEDRTFLPAHPQASAPSGCLITQATISMAEKKTLNVEWEFGGIDCLLFKGLSR
jgi:hypothetical protein